MRMNWSLLGALLVACGSDESSDVNAGDPVAPNQDSQTNPTPLVPAQQDTDNGGGGTSNSPGTNNTGTVSGPGAAPTGRFTGTVPANGFFRVASGASTYWVRLPKGYNVATPTAAPMVVMLHGCGDSAENFVQWAAAPPDLRANQSYIAVSMELGRNGQCWNDGADAAPVMTAIADARKYFYADQRKIHIGGYSSGGILAYKLGFANSTTFASIVIEHSAPGDLSRLSSVGRKIPITHNAGVNDGSFPIAPVRANIQTMKSAGFPVTFYEDPGGHDGDSAHFVKLINQALKSSI